MFANGSVVDNVQPILLSRHNIECQSFHITFIAGFCTEVFPRIFFSGISSCRTPMAKPYHGVPAWKHLCSSTPSQHALIYPTQQ